MLITALFRCVIDSSVPACILPLLEAAKSIYKKHSISVGAMFNHLMRRFPLALALAAWAQPALADTVDTQAKPYLVGGGWLAALVFAALGFFFVRKGIRYRRTAEAVAAWPLTEGKVLESGVAKRVDKNVESADITRYIPRVRYVYVVGGAALESDIIRIGLGDFGYTIEQTAREHAGRYPVGSKVLVRYDPADPQVAVLEAGQVGGAAKIFSGTIFLLLALSAIVFAVWTGGLQTH
jgi:hypothetical protein